MSFDFHILTPTPFPRCVSFGFQYWGLSLTFGVKFLAKFTQSHIIRAITVFQWFCGREGSQEQVSAMEDSNFLLTLRIHGDKIILPFFFESTDFFGDTERGFFAALEGTFMRGSLSELSSEFISEKVTHIKRFKASHYRQCSENTAEIWLMTYGNVTTCFLVICAIRSCCLVVFFLWFLSCCRDCFLFYQRLVIWRVIWNYTRRRYTKFSTLCF